MNCKFTYINVTQPDDQRWTLGQHWGIRFYEPGADRGGIIYIKKEETKNPQRVGPNQELSGSVLRIQPTQAFETQTPNSPKPLEVVNKSVGPKYKIKNEGMTENNMWRIMNASYYLLNQTNPNVPRPCWLCLDIRPPYYDAIGDLGEATRSSETDPPQCNWGRDVGITLTEVTGNGRCVGTVPSEKLHLCSITEKVTPENKEQWLIPADNARWVCSSTGVTPRLSLKLFDVSQDFCIQVIIAPRILYHSEECCVYADHTGVVRDTMMKLREGLEKRKRENEARQNWYKSWFNYSPWLTTLLSIIAGPLLLLVLGLTFGPCIFNRVIAMVKSRLEAAHLMHIRAKYEPITTDEDAETLMLSSQAYQELMNKITN
uniref:Envelope glycoprotein n=1 Tax=Anser cygnoides TaxID=8845 RepID=A0A8B9ES16_ANSCY